MGCASSTWNETEDTPQLRDLLSERQVQILNDTWAIIADDLEETGVKIFTKLFEMDKGMKGLFVRLAANLHDEQDVELDEMMLKKHSKVVMEALGASVECLNDTVYLNNVLISLGQIHAVYKVRPNHLPRLWPAVRYGLKDTLQDVFSDEIEETWKIVFGFIIGKMKEGIKNENLEATDFGELQSTDAENNEHQEKVAAPALK